MTNSPAVLVTGASSGIGLATARLLSESGYLVFAGVRRLSDGAPSPTLREIVLDVTSQESISAARLEIETLLGGRGLAGLVNNAGIGDVGPIEFTPVEKIQLVFAVNVFGMVSVTQAFLPLLHRACGRIINIGSIGGMITIPFGAALCSSKHAVEAISDCLRLELHDAGIAVTCLQPASINSGSAEKLAAENEKTIAALPQEGRLRYGRLLRHFMEVTLASETKGSPPSLVAEAVRAVLRAAKPPARQLVGKDGWLLKFAAKGLPDRLRDRIFRRIFFPGSGFGSRPVHPD